MDALNLSGKIALVNGASRGIGAAIAGGLAAAGAEVILTSRSLERAGAAAEAIAADGGKAEARACHAGRLDEIEALFDWLAGRHGRLDLLVNNAATNPYYGPAAGLTPAAFDKTVEVNLRGPYFMMAHAVQLMADGGSIVNVASILGLSPGPGQAVYAMTKAGLISLTKSFALEYGQRGVRVNAILPGVVETRFAAALVEDPNIQQWLRRLPAGRAGQPQDVVAGVLYLLSDQAAYTTGTTLVMDGGATAGLF